MCSACHISEPWSQRRAAAVHRLHLRQPGRAQATRMNPFYSMPRKWNPDGYAWVDLGLGGFLKEAGYPEEVYMAEMGKVKVPTLRNVDMRPYPEFVKSYGHNGFFKSLEEIVNFYNTRDVDPWPAPEYPENVNTDELGDLGLSDAEEAAIVAFMKTLSDGYVPEP
jgi:cytochrome c peroxidase